MAAGMRLHALFRTVLLGSMRTFSSRSWPSTTRVGAGEPAVAARSRAMQRCRRADGRTEPSELNDRGILLTPTGMSPQLRHTLGWARGRTSHPSAFQPLIALRHLLLCVLHWPLELWTSATWSCGLRCLRSWSRSCASAPRPIGEVRVHLYTINRCCWLQRTVVVRLQRSSMRRK